MSGLKLIWSERSVREYEALLDYIFEEWGESVALGVINKVNASIIRIEQSHEQFPVVVAETSIRRCLISPQTSIFFKVDRHVISIISVFDNRQDPKKL